MKQHAPFYMRLLSLLVFFLALFACSNRLAAQAIFPGETRLPNTGYSTGANTLTLCFATPNNIAAPGVFKTFLSASPKIGTTIQIRGHRLEGPVTPNLSGCVNAGTNTCFIVYNVGTCGACGSLSPPIVQIEPHSITVPQAGAVSLLATLSVGNFFWQAPLVIPNDPLLVGTTLAAQATNFYTNGLGTFTFLNEGVNLTIQP